MPKQTGPSLTAVELELMNILWSLKSASVREVLAELPKSRQMAYTSASTIIRILEQKGYVKAEKQGKTHFYSPILTKKEYSKTTLKQVVTNLFDGEPTQLIRQLINNEKLDKDEIAEIKKIIKEQL